MTLAFLVVCRLTDRSFVGAQNGPREQVQHQRRHS